MALQFRRERVEELLRSFIASKLMFADDESLRLVTITAVKVTKDLRYATVFWCEATARPSENAEKSLQDSLVEMIYSLRRSIAEELELRCVPEIKFKFDQTPFMAEKIDALLKNKI